MLCNIFHVMACITNAMHCNTVITSNFTVTMLRIERPNVYMSLQQTPVSSGETVSTDSHVLTISRLSFTGLTRKRVHSKTTIDSITTLPMETVSVVCYRTSCLAIHRAQGDSSAVLGTRLNLERSNSGSPSTHSRHGKIRCLKSPRFPL